jgi:hypothetical protein
MIRVEVVCHYDVYKNKSWPPYVAAVPHVGNLIAPLGRSSSLVIQEVEHCWNSDKKEPFLKLHVQTRDGKVPVDRY